MPRIHVIELSEVVGSFPEAKTFSGSEARFSKQVSFFICALGFEKRCLAVPGRLAEKKWRAGRCIYLEFSTNRDDNETNRAELLACLNSISDRVDPMEADGELFAASIRKVLRSIVEAAEGSRPTVVFDISVTSNRLLMRTMKVLFEYDLHLIVLYSEAAVYHPTVDEYKRAKSKAPSRNEPWLDRGVSEVTNSQEYPGYHVDQLPDCMLVIPGFNRDRVRASIYRVDPTLTSVRDEKIIWLIGVPHLPENQWRLELMREVLGLTQDIPQVEISTFDYKDSLCTLESLYRERVNRYRFTISPMGSKLQSLGCSFFCNLHPDVKVMFSVPEKYNAANFSEGCREMWIIEFESLRDTLQSLDRVGALMIQE